MKNRAYMAGQSLTEMMVAMLALIPIVWAIPMLGRYLNIEFQSQQASRFAVWQTTAYSGLTESSLESQTTERFYRHPLNGLGINRAISKNELWTDKIRTGNEYHRILSNQAGSEVNTRVDIGVETSDPTGGLVTNYARSLTWVVDGISARNMYNMSISVPLSAQAPTMAAVLASDSPDPEMANGNVLKTSNASIVSNTWMPLNEANFNQSIYQASRLASGSGLEWVQAGLPRAIANNPVASGFFPEATSAIEGNYNLTPANQTEILPEYQ